MKFLLLFLILVNTSCVNSNKVPTKVKSNKFSCKIDFEKINKFSYLKGKMNDFNSEYSDCIEAFFSYGKNIFDKKDKSYQEDYFKALKFIYDNSNSLSSTLIESSMFNDVFYDNIVFVSNYLFNNKETSLVKALKKGISHNYSVFGNIERDKKYDTLYKKVSNEIKNEEHKKYIIRLLDDIDRNLYD